MKWLLVLLIAITCNNTLFSQTVYGIFFIASSDEEAINNSFKHDLSAMNLLVETISNNVNYDYSKYIFDEKKCNGENFDRIASTLSTSEDDIIIVYISSHGARHPNDESPFPLVQLQPGQLRSPTKIFADLKKIPHKTLMVVSDACNNNLENLPAIPVTEEEREVYTKSFPEIGKVSISDIKKQNIKRIFIEKCFDLILTSSEPTKKSIIYKNSGSLFTNQLVSNMDEFFKLRKNSTIKEILYATGNGTYLESTRVSKMKYNEEKYGANNHKPYIPYGIMYGCTDKNTSAKITFNKTQLPDLEIKSTSHVVKDIDGTEVNEIELQLVGDRTLLNRTRQVKYVIPPGETNIPIKISLNKDNNFKCKVKMSGSGYIIATVTYDDGSNTEVGTYLENQHTHSYHWY